jgi:hypothetical protein
MMKNKDKKQMSILAILNDKNRLKLRLPTVLLTLFALGLFFSSCSELNFDDMNTNPTATTAKNINPGSFFTTTELAVSGTRYEVWRTMLAYNENIIQQLVTTTFARGNNYSVKANWIDAFFQNAYSGGPNGKQAAQVKRIEGVIHLLKQKKKNKDAKIANKMAEAQILRVFIYSRITDIYGDIPYFDAGKGAIDGKFSPKYDPQDSIYMDFFKKLKAAVQQLNSTPNLPTFGDHDIIYQGNINEWIKWANSLRLRFALRITKVKQKKAKKEAVAAINAPGGVMTSNADIPFIPHEKGPRSACCNHKENAVSLGFNGFDPMFIAQTLMQWMKKHHDPRVAAYATKGKNGKYIGFPSGYNNITFKNHPGDNPDSVDDYSRVSLSLRDIDDPFILQTYAEVQFMEAEMVVRGWLSGSAASHYKKGVTAAMKYLSLYDNGGSEPNEDISQSAIDNYLAANPFNTSGSEDQKLDQINTQYWAAVFLDGYEGFANWRRSGYPKLQPALVDSPNPPIGSVIGKQIPRRLTYPGNRESILNSKNYQEVINRQGPNKMTTRVWWDCGKESSQCVETP